MASPDRKNVLWVEDWPLNVFFLELFCDKDTTPDFKTDLLWSTVTKMLFAREGKRNSLKVSPEEISKERKVIAQEDQIKKGLRQKKITPEELDQYLTIENLYNQYLEQIKDRLRKKILDDSGHVQKIYENADLHVKDAYELLEVWDHTGRFSLNEDKLYTESELSDAGLSVKKLGVFAAPEIEKIYPAEEYGIIGRKPGQLVPIDVSRQEKLYYYIKDFHQEYKRNFDTVKEEFENFLYNYMLDEAVEEVAQSLMDQYTVKYNEDLLKIFFGED